MSKKYIEAQMKSHELYALWWMHYANTEHNKNRRVVRGDGHQLTTVELVGDAMETSKAHIQLFCELRDKIYE